MRRRCLLPPNWCAAIRSPAFTCWRTQSYVDGGRKFVTYAAVHSSATGGKLAQVTLPGLQYQGGYYTCDVQYPHLQRPCRCRACSTRAAITPRASRVPPTTGPSW